jgi:CTP:molybdopterin cytidylyltransferase MocA
MLAPVTETVRGLAAVVLAAGAGTRLRPLTDLRPKALCPVDNRPLVDWALDRVAAYAGRTAVNVHHHRDQLLAHLAERDVHLSVEDPVALGTAGALGRLRGWIDGAAVLLTNADSWFPVSPASPPPLAALVDGWDGVRPRLLCARDSQRGDFGDLRYVGAALLPWWSVRDLPEEPAGLYEVSWRRLHEAGGLDLVVSGGQHVDCGTPVDYLLANMLASGGTSVIGPGAVVEGEVVRSVVWPGASVGPNERLVDAIRAEDVTLRPGRG